MMITLRQVVEIVIVLMSQLGLIHAGHVILTDFSLPLVWLVRVRMFSNDVMSDGE